MNDRIKKLAEQAGHRYIPSSNSGSLRVEYLTPEIEKFAELIVQECRTVINDVYHKTPLELCGPLLTVDEEIMNHFYGVEKLT
jgi:hypothetical protein